MSTNSLSSFRSVSLKYNYMAHKTMLSLNNIKISNNEQLSVCTPRAQFRGKIILILDFRYEYMSIIVQFILYITSKKAKNRVEIRTFEDIFIFNE
jgi:hypothetical protein